jgi:hypothetical protein
MSEVSANETGTLGALGSAYFQRRYTILFYSLLFTIAGCERDALPALSIASAIYDYLPVAWLRSLMLTSL